MSKRKIKVDQLVNQSNFYKFQMNRLYFKFFFFAAFSTTVSLPAIALIESFFYKIIISIAFLSIMLSLSIWYIIRHKEIKQKIKKISKEIHDIYEDLLN